MNIQEEAVLIMDSHHGVYIPQLIVTHERNNPQWDWSKCNEEDIQACINGTEDEWYWEAWNNIEQNVKVFNDKGNEYFLISNEDVWAIPVECVDQLND